MKRYFAAWMLLLFLLCACDAQEPSEKPRMPITNGQTEEAAMVEVVDAEGTYRVTSEKAESGELLFLMQTEDGAAAVYTEQAQGAYILHAEDSRRDAQCVQGMAQGAAAADGIPVRVFVAEDQDAAGLPQPGGGLLHIQRFGHGVVILSGAGFTPRPSRRLLRRLPPSALSAVH